MAKEIKVSVRVGSEWVDVLLPFEAVGKEINEIAVESEAVTVRFTPEQRTMQGARVSVQCDRTKLKYEECDVHLTNGKRSEDDRLWYERTDAMLYINGERIIGKNMTNGSNHGEKRIATKAWYYNG